MKKGYLVLAFIIVLVVVGIGLFFIISKSEKVAESKTANETECALKLYNEAKDKGIKFLSQCLGNCGDYAVDVVHVPRNEVDNKIENQCEDYRSGKARQFIELDQEGNIVRIV